jgi:hypothetical protein
MSDIETPSPWEEAVKTMSDHTYVLGENGLVKTWYAFLNAESDGFLYRLKVRLDPQEQKTPEDYDLTEINQSFLQNTDTIAKNFSFKYARYLASKA